MSCFIFRTTASERGYGATHPCFLLKGNSNNSNKECRRAFSHGRCVDPLKHLYVFDLLVSFRCESELCRRSRSELKHTHKDLQQVAAADVPMHRRLQPESCTAKKTTCMPEEPIGSIQPASKKKTA